MKQLIFAAILGAALSTSAWADGVASSQVNACGQTTVAALIGTTCSIGDKSFTFSGYNGVGQSGEASAPPLAQDRILFIPDATDPYNISFTLSSTEYHVASTNTTDGQLQFGELSFIISPSPDPLFLASFDVNVNGGSASSGPATPTNSPGAWAAGNLGFFGTECTATNIVGSNTDGPLYIHESCGFEPDKPLSGYAYWGLSGGGGPTSASMDSVRYTFRLDDVQPVPEPSSLLLLSCGVVGLVAVRRRLQK